MDPKVEARLNAWLSRSCLKGSFEGKKLRAHVQLIEVRDIVNGVSYNPAKDRVLPVQVRTCIQGDEELAAVCVWLVLVGTGHKASACTILDSRSSSINALGPCLCLSSYHVSDQTQERPVLAEADL